MTQKQNHAIKLSPMIDIPQTFRDLPETFAVHMVAVEGECKGVVFLLSRNNFPVNDIHRRDAIYRVRDSDAIYRVRNSDPIYRVRNSNPIYRVRNSNPETDIIADGTDLLNETIDAIIASRQSWPSILAKMRSPASRPPCIATELGTYLYEPNTIVMKDGIFNALSQKFQVAKLAKNTNLFSANEVHKNFPGRIFRIEAVHELHPRKMAKELSHLASASIAVRNFPLSAVFCFVRIPK